MLVPSSLRSPLFLVLTLLTPIETKACVCVISIDSGDICSPLVCSLLSSVKPGLIREKQKKGREKLTHSQTVRLSCVCICRRCLSFFCVFLFSNSVCTVFKLEKSVLVSGSGSGSPPPSPFLSVSLSQLLNGVAEVEHSSLAKVFHHQQQSARLPVCQHRSPLHQLANEFGDTAAESCVLIFD